MSEATMFQSAAAGSDYEGNAGSSDWATIGDLAREFDVTLRTLRFYEARGLLSPRRAGMNRYYSPKDRARLAVILKGKKLGFTLTEIRQMIAQSEDDRSVLNLSVAQIDDQLKLLRTQLGEVQAAIAELEDRRASMLTGQKG